jgi:hypothetical protein
MAGPIRDALGIRPGDTIRYELEAGTVRLKVVRPDIADVLQTLWAKHDALAQSLGVEPAPDRPGASGTAATGRPQVLLPECCPRHDLRNES